MPTNLCRLLLLSILYAVLLMPAVMAQELPPLVNDYCLSCHNTEDWAGSLALDMLDYAHAEEDARDWEKVVRKLRAGMMPPAGEPKPAAAQLEGFITTLENRLDEQVGIPASPPALHRLNRTEYANAIRDLLALNVDVNALLPQDNASEGFDNIASSLGFSPALIQGYTSAAMKVAQWAVGDMSTTEQSHIYNNPANLLQDKHLDGMPFGTRGGIRIRHNFPLDAEYEVVILGGIGFGRSPDISGLYMALDGVRFEPDSNRRFRLSLTAGVHELNIALLDYQRPEGVNDIYSQYQTSGGINGIEIHGPYHATGTGDTASRRAIFSCYPATNDEATECARQILSELASRAFRTPLQESELEPLMTFYHRGVAEGDFETGIQQGLSRILIDPRFLFRLEEEPADLRPGDVYQITGIELASRLSFFLWSSIPDAELLELAVSNRLHEPEVLQQQVARMLDDPRAQALVDNFAGQWLHLRELTSLTPETDAFNDNLRQAFIGETRMLFAHIISEDLPVTDVLDASYTFLNEELAQHYGIEGVHGDYFRRVELSADSPRRGILGQASFLTVSSTASRTSPVIRGNWILENLLHAPVPAPPPGVETNLDGDGSEELRTSVRERLEAHRADPACSSCHSVIDPVGFALENFDMIGAWRTVDGDSAVDASGTLVDGTVVHGPADLRKALMARSDLFVSTVTEKLLTYALGRKLEYYDMPAVRAIVREASGHDNRFSAIVNAIVSSELFLTRAAVGSGGSDPGSLNSNELVQIQESL